MEETDIHQRLLKLRDVSLGLQKTIGVNSDLASASYDCTVDSLLALYNECKGASSLAKDQNVLRFMKKYKDTVLALEKLRVRADNFEMKSTIGRGHFGEVVVCHEKSTGDVFAMKIMKKSHILQQPDAAFFSAERDIMAWGKSPWLTSLHYAFQDSTSLYLVMDYHPGGDLLNIMERKDGSMHEDEVRFYLSEIAAGLHDLHSLGFVHRDVKPENVLIARSGHIKLVDFGSAARLGHNGKVIESKLPVGTPEYIAPEVLTSLDKTADYGVCCDWWSLGIIAYELLYEVTPFEGDTTSKTYNNIMNFKKSLSFPGSSRTSSEEEARDLIKGLLLESKTRLTYKDILKHPYFSLIDWDHLLDVLPPHIPTISGPDDVSNFDVFEPQSKDNFRFPDLPSRTTGFSGRSLPFIGFTFSRPLTPEDYTDSYSSTERGGEEEVKESKALKRVLNKVQKELEEEKSKKSSLVRECIVYQSQLEDFHRKLEMEKSDRRLSDSKALKLLQEVKEKGQMAQQLRKEQTRSTEMEYSIVVEQLEQERQEASKKLQRFQDRLKEMQKERDSAVKKGVEYKAKLAEAKESGRKEITGLQARLAKLSKESSAKVEEVENSLLQVREHYAEALKKVKSAENAKKRVDAELRKLKANSNKNSTTADMNRQLKEIKCLNEELQAKLEGQSKVSEDLQKRCTSLTTQVKEVEGQLDEASSWNQTLEKDKLCLERQVYELKKQVNEMTQETAKLKEDLKAAVQESEKKEETISKLEAGHQTLESKHLAEVNAFKEFNHKTASDEKLKATLRKVENLEKEKQNLKKNLSTISAELTAQVKQTKTLTDQMAKLEKKNKEVVSGLHEEIKVLQGKVSETTTMALQQGDRLREVRKARRSLDQENTNLSGKLRSAEKTSEKFTKQLKESTEELEKLRSVADKLKQAESTIETLQEDNLMLKELTSAKDQAEAKLSRLQKQFEAQELNTALLQRNIKSLEQELKESQVSLQEAQKQQTHWKNIRITVEGDLEIAEAKLEELTANINKEKTARLAAEHKLSKSMEDMQKIILEHLEELEKTTEQLAAQKELAAKYSSKILELEKEVRITSLNLKETEKALGTEKAVSSKFYDEIQFKGRELGKLKAAHMKLVKEVQQRNLELVQRDQVLDQQRMASDKHQLQETRLQSTIAQQNKLINYLQGVGTSPQPRGLGRIKKGLKLVRKGRDPVKEIAEWKKLKGIAGKGGASLNARGSMANSSSCNQLTSSSSLNFSPPAPIDQPHHGRSSSENDSGMEMSSSGESVTEVTAIATSLSDSSSTTTASRPGVIVGTKRNANEVSSLEPSGGISKTTGQHNIPHKFRGISKSGLRSNYTCAACKGPIKALQKLIKCQYCHVTCHAQCIDTLPNNCGLPQELSSYAELKEPSSKRQKQGDHKSTSQSASSNSPHQEVSKRPIKVTKRPTSSSEKKSVSGKKPKDGEMMLFHVVTRSGNKYETIVNDVVQSKKSSPKVTKKSSPKVTKKSSPKGTKKSSPKVTKKSSPKGTKKSSPKKGVKRSLQVSLSNSVEPVIHKDTSPKKPKKDDEKSLQTSQAGSEGLEENDDGEKQSHVSKIRGKVTLSQHSKTTLSASSGEDNTGGGSSTDMKGSRFSSPTKTNNENKNNWVEKKSSGFYTGFDSSKVIKMDRTSQPRGGMMTEGWLVLTRDTLCLYDRDPRGVTRKPIHNFVLNQPGVAYVIIPSVSKHFLPHCSPSSLMRAFAFQSHSSNSSQQCCFVSSSLQGKIEWVEEIQKILSAHTSPPEKTSEVSLENNTPTNSSRELKEVSIVPISSTPRYSDTSTTNSSSIGLTNESMQTVTRSSLSAVDVVEKDLDLSIRSSMFNSSSESSFI